MRSPYLPVEESTLENSSGDFENFKAESRDQCGYCNSRLLYTHELNLSLFEVVESCRCSGCGVTKTPQRFSLQ